MVRKIIIWKNTFRKCENVYLDTSILIYLFQDQQKYSELLEDIFYLLESENINICFSSLLLTELLVDPLKNGQLDIAKNWLSYFKIAQNLEIIDLNPPIAVDAAFLRAKYNIKTPDCIHLATAMQKAKSVFLTNDIDLKKVKEVKVLCIKDFL